MSNLQALKGLYDAFGRGDLPAVLGVMHERIDWREPESMPYGSQVGRQAVAENIFGAVLRDVTGFTVTVDEFVDGGDVVVTIGNYRGTGVKTGISFDTPFVHVWRFTDGKASYFRTYTDTKIWYDALGVGAVGV